jgi:hypothetical protein
MNGNRFSNQTGNKEDFYSKIFKVILFTKLGFNGNGMEKNLCNCPPTRFVSVIKMNVKVHLLLEPNT